MTVILGGYLNAIFFMAENPVILVFFGALVSVTLFVWFRYRRGLHDTDD